MSIPTLRQHLDDVRAFINVDESNSERTLHSVLLICDMLLSEIEEATGRIGALEERLNDAEYHIEVLQTPDTPDWMR